ncbi:MFS general substrate transporter [Conidiobolus coronatus NRRL 28638]|uniref:MFS general substrate transporter n=1 Tax=Conidiobolus coronatus (strain ATCC 28846 / CBS 209.66 / NRRL 28638) TaxID=796925 RepID=A0A137NXQ6_CONC2|nr:MFS general substrate transporter [Conidiobolus coronatus NRRL 28638]|eukprot:KXN67650.1 MFS general substrate transporter [Conidiobolus coronatus NRRL 28638]
MVNYYSAIVQNIMVGLICFCCPGMFNALSGMGGGGQVDPTVAAQAATALYVTFAIFGVFGGAFVNTFGPKITLVTGGLTYAFYSCSFLAYNHIQSRVFVIIAGAVLGIGAGLLWSAQGALMMAYPTQNEKGKFISIFWVIFNLGGVLGGLISFGINYKNPSPTVTDGTYIAFIVIMAFGAGIGLVMAPIEKVVKSDGTGITVNKAPAVKGEIVGVLKVFTEWRMIVLLPLFFVSNFFYTYQFNSYNGTTFTIRTRGLNNVVYWGSQMVGSVLLGFLLDTPRLTRKMRGIISFIIVVAIMTSVWIGGYFTQVIRTEEGVLPEADRVDFSSSNYGPLLVMYLCYGLSDAMIQSWSYWIMGTMSNDAATLSRYAGFYKGVQSIGAAVAWAIDSNGTVSQMTQLITNWALFSAAVIPAIFMTFTIKEYTDSEEPAPEYEKKQVDH